MIFGGIRLRGTGQRTFSANLIWMLRMLDTRSPLDVTYGWHTIYPRTGNCPSERVATYFLQKYIKSNTSANGGNYLNSNHTFIVHSFLIFAVLYATLRNPKLLRSSAVNNPTTTASCTSVAVRWLPCASAYLTQRLKIPGKSWTSALENDTLCPALNSSAARLRK